MSSLVSVSINEAKLNTAAALRSLGWSQADADMQADIMLYAELRGSNQGENEMSSGEGVIVFLVFFPRLTGALSFSGVYGRHDQVGAA